MYTAQGMLICRPSVVEKYINNNGDVATSNSVPRVDANLPNQVDPINEEKPSSAPNLQGLQLCDTDQESHQQMCKDLGGKCQKTYAMKASGEYTIVSACTK
jgi:hypothetical protein